MWDFSRYNVIVQQVEGASDLLRDAANRIAPTVNQDPAGVAPLLLAGLRLAVDELDQRALAMLSVYDPMAAAYIRQGLRRDPRRGPVKTPDPPETPAQIAAGEAYQQLERDRPKNLAGKLRRKLLKKGR